MALTNYITQTIIGITVFATLFEKSEMSRTGVWLFIVCVWAVQILWSKAWLTRFRSALLNGCGDVQHIDHGSLSCDLHLKIDIK